ncbi:MAG: caspase family protein [Bradyrhizobium sp.]
MMHLPGYLTWRQLLLTAVLLLAWQPAFAEKRVALVIGDSAYQNAPQLANPVNDAKLIASKLKQAGFDVVESRHDLTGTEMRRALRDFEDKTRGADIAVVYYAGHGIEVGGANYLIPVDAKLKRDSDVYDEAVSLDRVMFAMEPARKLRLVILDACRNNPFVQTMKRSVAMRSIGRGLAKVEPSDPNTLIAYSAKAGSTAADGEGKDSPFAMALARHLTTPGLDIRRALGYVRDDVLKATSNRQEPFVYGSLGGEDVALVSAAAKPRPATDAQAGERHDYELALQLGNQAAWNVFLAEYPKGFYASLARLQIKKIAAEKAQAAADKRADQAEKQQARLAAAGAPKGIQSKAVADAKAAEAARLAAEKASQAAKDQAAQAERGRDGKAAEAASLGDKPPAPPMPSVPDKATKVAALTAGSPPADITKSVQIELRRVGCLTGAADGDWGTGSRRSLSLFNRYAGIRLNTKVASGGALDAIKQKRSRVCPLICQHGFKASGDRCTRIVCAKGSFLNGDNECERRHGAVTAKRNERRHGRASHEGSSREGHAARVAASKSGSPRQIICDDHYCHPVRRGCHLQDNSPYAHKASGGTAEICN